LVGLAKPAQAIFEDGTKRGPNRLKSLGAPVKMPVGWS
jgi:hypothetical protein